MGDLYSPAQRQRVRSSLARPRVAFLTDIITPYLARVLEALADRVELTALFCSRTGTRGMNWNIELSFRHEIIEGFTIRRRTDATDYYLSPRIFAAIRRASPDAIICSGFSVPTLYAILYSRARRIPLIVQSDGTSNSEAQLGVEQRLARRLLGRFAWGAAANSSAAARRFIEIGFDRERVFLAPHAVDVEPLWKVAESRSRRGDEGLRVLSVGRFIAGKGFDLLLRAAAEARHNGTELRLIMVGTGPEESRLKSLAADLELPVDWPGFVPSADMPQRYAAADVFVFATLGDTFGIVLVEAAAAGLPLIASPFAGATEDLVHDGANGFVVDPNDTAAMAAAIARLNDEPELRARMGRASQKLTLTRTPAISAVGYVEAVEAALAAARGR